MEDLTPGPKHWQTVHTLHKHICFPEGIKKDLLSPHPHCLTYLNRARNPGQPCLMKATSRSALKERLYVDKAGWRNEQGGHIL